MSWEVLLPISISALTLALHFIDRRKNARKEKVETLEDRVERLESELKACHREKMTLTQDLITCRRESDALAARLAAVNAHH